MKQLALACQNHHDTKGYFPSATRDSVQYSYIAQVLPFIESQNLSNLVDLEQPWSAPANEVAEQTPIAQVQCPSIGQEMPTFIELPGQSAYAEQSDLRSHFYAILGAKVSCPERLNAPDPLPSYTMKNCEPTTGGWANNGIIFPESKINFRRITDGSSSTMLLGEVSWRDAGPARTWIVGYAGASRSFVYNAVNLAYPMKQAFRNNAQTGLIGGFGSNDVSLGSEHPGGCHASFADGSVHFLNEDISFEQVLRPLASRQSGEVIPVLF
jgi:prepilin-type processing-associated H-X9-DG protein